MKQRADVEIKLCGRECIEEVAELERRCIQGGWSEKGFEEWLEHNGNAVLAGAFKGGRLVGFANGSFAFEEGELLNIAVDEKFRRQGIAQMLLDELFQQFKGGNVEKVFLEVREQNKAALAFYRKNGFEQVGLRKNYYSEPRDNGVVMVYATQ